MNTVTLNTKGLQEIRRKLNVVGKSHVDVGIFSDHNARDDGETNAEVGAKMEFGSTEESTPSDAQIKARGREYEIIPTWSGNPARSFLEMPLKTDLPSRINNQGSLLVDGLVEFGPNQFLNLIGIMASKSVDAAFETEGFGTWAPNSEKTQEWKGSSKPLIDSSQLRQSISHRVIKGSAGDSNPF